MKTVSTWFALALVVAGSGCATDPEGSSPAVNGWIDLAPDTVIEVRTGRLDLVFGYYLPKSKDEAAGRGARGGLAIPVAAAAVSPWGLLAAPVTVPLGALFGSASGMSDVEAARCREPLTNEASQLHFIPSVTAELLRLGKQKTPFQWRIEDATPSAEGAVPSNGPQTVIVEILPACFALSPWRGEPNGINPPLELVGEINCVIYSADKTEHFTIERFGYHSTARLFREWATTPGLLTREAARCNQQLARRIVADLFEVKLRSAAERRGRSKGGL